MEGRDFYCIMILMRSLRIAILFFLIAFVGWGVYGLIQEHSSLDGEVEILRERSNKIKEENTLTAGRIDFFKNPDNLVKELKSQKNVVAPGESLIIVIPPKATTTPINATSTE